MATSTLEILDTTFRDGAQGMDTTITSLEDVIAAVVALDELSCISYLEMGFATSSGPDRDRIKAALELELSAKVTAFGRTHPKDVEAILGLGTPAAVLVGKSRRSDVERVIRVSPEGYLGDVRDCVRDLASSGIDVIFDAEHFFDGFLEDPHYALQVLLAGIEGGAKRVVLCDTNGSMTLRNAQDVINRAQWNKLLCDALGVHFHNDRGRAVPLSEAAYDMGVQHIQGTFGGFGERCGNADLSTIIANLVVDHDHADISGDGLAKLLDTYQLVCAALNRPTDVTHPYVGRFAFSTQAGMHQSGEDRVPGNYTHADPILFGNAVHTGLTTQSGKSSLLKRAEEVGVIIPDEAVERLTAEFTELVEGGYDFASEATFELWLVRSLGLYEYPFEVAECETSIRVMDREPRPTLVNLRLQMDDNELLHVADGDGPVDAIVGCFVRSLHDQFPGIADVKLRGFRVQTFDVQRGSAAKVQVFIRWSDGPHIWRTMSAHENLIYACMLAVLDGFVYKIFRNGKMT